MTASDVPGKLTLTRTVKNVTAATATYASSASLAGWNVAVTPASLTLAPGASATFNVALTRTSASTGTWSFGNLTWSDGVRQVRSGICNSRFPRVCSWNMAHRLVGRVRPFLLAASRR